MMFYLCKRYLLKCLSLFIEEKVKRLMVNLLINIIIIQLFLGNIGCFFGGGKCVKWEWEMLGVLRGVEKIYALIKRFLHLGV